MMTNEDDERQSAQLLSASEEAADSSVFFDKAETQHSAGALAGTSVDAVADDMTRSSLKEFYTEGSWSDGEEEGGARRAGGLEDALPMDKLRNGAATAAKFLSWGASAITEQAKGLNEQLQKNDNVRHATERAGEIYESRVKPGVEKAREGAASVLERAKPKVEELSERAGPALQETWAAARTKAGELSEACRPGIERAREQASELIGRKSGATSDAGAKPAADEPRSEDI